MIDNSKAQETLNQAIDKAQAATNGQELVEAFTLANKVSGGNAETRDLMDAFNRRFNEARRRVG
jgi:hypothetical protein